MVWGLNFMWYETTGVSYEGFHWYERGKWLNTVSHFHNLRMCTILYGALFKMSTLKN